MLWFLASFSFPGEQEKTRMQARTEAGNLNMNADETEHYVASQLLEHSFAGKIGKSIEPFIAPLGFDWKIGIALITSFAAREVFVGTMSTIYSLGPDSDVNTLKEKDGIGKGPKWGQILYTKKITFSGIILCFCDAMHEHHGCHAKGNRPMEMGIAPILLHGGTGLPEQPVGIPVHVIDFI
ncbi:MAG: hypothetical protein IPL22_19995 [Bacteroidetes bacterium]|nr:hypothetical protein [Bacteroidota bacterium]